MVKIHITDRIIKPFFRNADIQKDMKRFLLSCLCVFFIFPLAALERGMFADNQAALDAIMAKIKTAEKPRVVGDYIVFTADGSARYTGIAFEHEQYKTIHSFKRLVKGGIDDDTKTQVLFYIFKIPEHLFSIDYRLVVDGLWTADPVNPDMRFDDSSGLPVSQILLSSKTENKSEALDGNIVRFVYEGDSGQTIRVGGSFTNWDSFIYELQEIKPGLYRLELPLPKGKYYYSYYRGMSAFTDKTNPEKVYTADGRAASVITVR